MDVSVLFLWQYGDWNLWGSFSLSLDNYTQNFATFIVLKSILYIHFFLLCSSANTIIGIMDRQEKSVFVQNAFIESNFTLHIHRNTNT